MKTLNQIIIEKTKNGGYFTHVTNYPYLYVLSEFLYDIGTSPRVINFLKNDTELGLSISEHALGKCDNDMIYIEPDMPRKEAPNMYIKRSTLINILENFQTFAKEGSPEIILTEENGIYTMTSQGKTVHIN